MRATLNCTFTTQIQQQGLTWAETRGPRQGTRRWHESVDFPDFVLPFGHDFDAMSLLIRFYSQSSCDRELSLLQFPKLTTVPPSYAQEPVASNPSSGLSPLCCACHFAKNALCLASSCHFPKASRIQLGCSLLLAAARCSVTRVSKPSLHFSFTVREQKNVMNA